MRSLLPMVCLLAACTADVGAEDESDDAVTVDTSTPTARAQYDANVAFARGYTARCKPAANNGHKRAIITGFGRFLYISENATGRIVSSVVPAAKYPMTTPPSGDDVDQPAPQTSVAVGTVHLANAGDVDVCAMIVPVYWDLAAILIAKEIDAFAPNVVVMNGVADSEQDLWIELGGINRAMTDVDGSNRLQPIAAPGHTSIPLVPSGALLAGNLLSWHAVENAARDTVSEHGSDVEEGRRFDEVLTGAKLAGFPRSGNTYLCNNVTYTTNWLMGHAGTSITLLKASKPVNGKPNSVTIKIARDVRKVPRTFLHWPSTLSGKHIADAADVLESVLDAQLSTADAPSVGTNAMAEIQSSGGTF